MKLIILRSVYLELDCEPLQMASLVRAEQEHDVEAVPTDERSPSCLSSNTTFVEKGEIG